MRTYRIAKVLCWVIILGLLVVVVDLVREANHTGGVRIGSYSITDVTFSFQVVDATTKQPIRDATLELFDERAEDESFLPKHLATLLTDVDGKAAYTRKKSLYSFTVSVSDWGSRTYRTPRPDRSWCAFSVAAKGYQPLYDRLLSDYEPKVRGDVSIQTPSFEFVIPLLRDN